MLSGTGPAAVDPADAEKLARRRAFLDADSSMAGLKAVQAQKGIVYAGGQYNMINPNQGKEGENDFLKISKRDAQSYMRGRQGAAELKDKYVTEITAASQPTIQETGDQLASAEQSTPVVDTQVYKQDPEYNLTSAPAFTDKDRTGRYNNFR